MPSRRQILLASAALLGGARPALAAIATNNLQLRVEYAATSVTGADERAAPGRLWRTSSSLRHQGKRGGRPLTVIARLDRNLGWFVMDEPRLAIEADLSALDLPLDALNGGGGVRQTNEGRERISGLDTMRIRVERNTGRGSRFAGHVWATEQGVIARLAGEGESHGRRGRTLMNFRDIEIGPLDPGLFEAPRGVRIVRVDGGDLATLLDGMEAAAQLGGQFGFAR